MANENQILRTSATGFTAAANWIQKDGSSAGTDVSDTDNTRIINEFAGSLTATLDPGFGVNGGLDYLIVNPACVGQVGTSAGPIVAPTDDDLYSLSTTRAAIVYKASGGALYLSGNGGTTEDLIHIYHQNSGGQAFFVGTWTARHVFLESGRLQVVGTVGSESGYEWCLSGGSIDILDSSTGLHTVIVTGGNHVIRRGFQGTLEVAGGTVTIDAGGRTFAAIKVTGGTCIMRNCGDVTLFTALGGIIDESQSQRPITYATQVDAITATFIPSPNITRTTRKKYGTGAKGLT